MVWCTIQELLTCSHSVVFFPQHWFITQPSLPFGTQMWNPRLPDHYKMWIIWHCAPGAGDWTPPMIQRLNWSRHLLSDWWHSQNPSASLHWPDYVRVRVPVRVFVCDCRGDNQQWPEGLSCPCCCAAWSCPGLGLPVGPFQLTPPSCHPLSPPPLLFPLKLPSVILLFPFEETLLWFPHFSDTEDKRGSKRKLWRCP